MKTPKIVGRECLEAGKHSQESQRGLKIGKGDTGHNSTKTDLHELHLLRPFLSQYFIIIQGYMSFQNLHK